MKNIKILPFIITTLLITSCGQTPKVVEEDCLSLYSDSSRLYFDSLSEKDNSVATIIGERSAGGSCTISLISNSTGFIYYSSSENVAVMKDEDIYIPNDYGVTPDITVDRSLWYDHAKLDELLSSK